MSPKAGGPSTEDISGRAWALFFFLPVFVLCVLRDEAEARHGGEGVEKGREDKAEEREETATVRHTRGEETALGRFFGRMSLSASFSNEAAAACPSRAAVVSLQRSDAAGSSRRPADVHDTSVTGRVGKRDQVAHSRLIPNGGSRTIGDRAALFAGVSPLGTAVSPSGKRLAEEEAALLA